MNEVEILKKENEQLKATVKELRRQLETYRIRNKRKYYADYDNIPYQDDDRHGNDSAALG